MIYFLAYTAIGLGLGLYYRIKNGEPEISNLEYFGMFVFLWPLFVLGFALTGDL